jgi:uncharacterized membrane protein HdeD (DUF308 family)
MMLPGNSDLEIIRIKVAAMIHAHWNLFLVQGVLMLVLATIAIALPNISTVEIELLVGWLFLVGGFVRTATLLKRRHLPDFGCRYQLQCSRRCSAFCRSPDRCAAY